MARINLLPWRETLRKERQRDFGIAVGVALAFTAGIMFLVRLQVDAMIEYQKSRNDFLRLEIVKVDEKIKQIEELEKTKQRLIARMEIIEQLQQSRPLVVHLFDEVVNTTPEGTFLNTLAQTGATVTLDGTAQSNTRVSAYMRNIEGCAWLEDPVLQVIDTTNENAAHFVLTAQIKGALEAEQAKAARETKKELKPQGK
jgi:type IV pilus assembly protein PilN